MNVDDVSKISKLSSANAVEAHRVKLLRHKIYLKDMPVSLPFSWGKTLPTALAAPVEEGMMFPAAALPPRQSFLLGPSTVF